MFQKKEVERILGQTKRMDPAFEMFGVSRHKYELNPPIDPAFVREVEELYHFRLPEDYVQFITEVGDGGAGPDYGIGPFRFFLQKAESPGAEKFREAYRCSLAKPFLLRPMESDELEYFAFSEDAYKKSPEKYFVETGESDENSLCDTDGYYVLGTHGCQWNFGLVISGTRRGQVFDTDNEGGYRFVADSFHEFYQNWLDELSDTEQFQKKLDHWRKIRNR